MFISIIGTAASGKKTTQDYIRSKGFTLLTLNEDGGHQGLLQDDRTQHYVDGKSSNPNDGSSTSPVISFGNSSTMLDYVTRNWQSKFVTTSLLTFEDLEIFVKRPFFLLVAVDAPISLRWKRSSQREGINENDHIQLVDFLSQHDQIMYGQKAGLRPTGLTSLLTKLPSLQITNDFDTIPDFHQYLENKDLLDQDRLRPGWDTYFMTLSELASRRSNCMKRRVGAVLVRNNRILSTGYNGTARGMINCNEGGCSRCNGQARSGVALDECLCLHAEENALLEAGRERVGDGAVLYCNTCPCLRCSVKIVQTGVKVVVYNFAYSMDSASAMVFKQAGVELRQHTPPQN